MTVLVTGGSGFIGTHLVDGLLEQGHHVHVLDKLQPRQDKAVWFKGNILNPADVAEACRDVESIFHLAAIADVNSALTNPQQCVSVNEVGTVNVLEVARGLEVERVVLASSTWVYGKQEEVTEESPIPHPDHIYTKTKIGQEQLVYSWNSTYGLPYTILRYGIPYGPRMRSNLVLSIFVRRAKSGDPLTIFGDGKQGRCFIWVKDLIEGNMLALKREGENQIFNLAGSEFITIVDMVEELKQHFDLTVIHQPPRPGDFMGTRVVIKKANQMLGWAPRTSFSAGIKKYLKHMKT